MKTTTSRCAALVGAAAAVMIAVPASADSGSSDEADEAARAAVTALASGADGCVSDADYAGLANGQRLSYVRRVAGGDAQVGVRYWDRGAYAYQERRYAMCTPADSAHGTLTTRFMYFQGAWRAMLVDTYVGPEPL